MTIRNSKPKRKPPRRRRLTLETCEHRFLLAADLSLLQTDSLATIDNTGAFADTHPSELVDIGGFLVREVDLTDLNSVNQNLTGAAYNNGTDVLHWVRVDSHFDFGDVIRFNDVIRGDMRSIDDVKFLPWLGLPPTETSVELDTQSTPFTDHSESLNNRQLPVSGAPTTTNIYDSLPQKLLNDYSPAVSNTLILSPHIDTLAPASDNVRLRTITEHELTLNRRAQTTLASETNALRGQVANNDTAIIDRYPINTSGATVRVTMDNEATLNDRDASSVASTSYSSQTIRNDPSIQSNPNRVLGPEFPSQATTNLAEQDRPHESAGRKMVDITHMLGQQGRQEPRHNSSHTGIVNMAFEPSLALASSYQVISSSRVQMPPETAAFSVLVVHPPHRAKSTAMGLQHASRSRAQAFDTVDWESVKVNSVSLAGVFHPTVYQSSESTWTRYVPAHVSVPTLPLVFTMAVPHEQGLSHVDPTDSADPRLEPTSATKPHRASTVNFEQQDKETGSDRKAATMVFSVFAVQQLWRYDRRKNRLTANFREVLRGGLKRILAVVELPSDWWRSFNNRRREWQSRRRVPRPIFPAANSREDQRH